MKKLEKEMLSAVLNGRPMKNTNTQVVIYRGTTEVYLFGNLIYKVSDGGKKSFTLAGYNTVTTRSRLRALNVPVTCKDFTPHLDGKPINSFDWYTL